jgi:hypothetical protein
MFIYRMVNIGIEIAVLHVYVYKERPSVGVKTA